MDVAGRIVVIRLLHREMGKFCLGSLGYCTITCASFKYNLKATEMKLQLACVKITSQLLPNYKMQTQSAWWPMLPVCQVILTQFG